jgi:hypothetical protein
MNRWNEMKPHATGTKISSPISSFDSLNVVAASSTSPSSVFPPGNATSPENTKQSIQIHKQMRTSGQTDLTKLTKLYKKMDGERGSAGFGQPHGA